MTQGLLSPRKLVGLGRDTSEALSGDDPEAGLRRLLERLVPDVADGATLLVLGSDGRLHVRTTSGEVGSVGAAGDSPDGSIAVDGDHPAAAACRESRLTFVLKEGGEPRVLGRNGDAPSDDARIDAAALPLVREGDCVGVLHLRLAGGRHFTPADLEYLDDFARRVSLFLESARLRKEVREARRAKSDFLSVMSHELRTPLTAVVGYADLLEAGIPGPVNERQVRHLVRIKESAWQLLELIDGILGYARYEGEDPDLRVEVVRPEGLVQDALRTLQADFRDKGLALTVDAQEGLPSLRTDREKAIRVLFHLLSNAGKFTDRGDVRVELRADRDWVTFVIRDSGPGIPRAELEQIFEPFWQGERAETRTKGGTGMGLSLARRLAELITGRIEVESAEGEGSTFTLRLPRQGPHPSFP